MKKLLLSVLGIILIIVAVSMYSMLSYKDDFLTEGHDEYYTNVFDETYRIHYFHYVNRDPTSAGYEKINVFADDIFIYANESGRGESITEVFKIISQDDINIYVLRNNYGKEMLAWKDEDGNNRMFNILDVTRDPADISFNYIFGCISDNIDSVKEKYAEMGLSDKNIVKFVAKEG